MGSVGETQATVSGTIPVVDFSKWSSSTSEEERLAVAKELTDACREVGFAYIVNHGLPQDLLDRAFATSRKLFDLSHEEKMQAPHPDGPDVHRGYSYPGLEKVSQYMGSDEKVAAQERQTRDCKESYEIGSEELAQQPNVWLPEATLPAFRQFTSDFYWECNKVAQSILRAMSLGIGPGVADRLVKHHSGHNNQLRLLHYPPVAAAELANETAARMPAHWDWGSITILFQDDCGGLEVEDPHTPGKFVPATPIPGACLINVGDLLMRWSNDDLKSTKHRVTLPPLSDRFEGEQRMTRERYSVVYFVSPDPETLVECLPACTDTKHPAKYKPITQESYRAMRARLQYPKSKAVSAAA